jgi:sulfur carrier protein ThiS
MRMHRGSSKDAPGTPRTSGSLPLSASASPTVAVVLELTRAGASERRRLRVPVGTPVRETLHRVGLAPEGCAVLRGDVPVPLDLPIDRAMRLTVVSTFSGG